MSDYEKIDEEFLGGVIHQELNSAETWMASDLASEQEDKGIMPELMKLFAGGDTVVEFDPVFPGDETQIEIEGAYINHLFFNRGDGYKVLYNWFKDALLMKNGLIKVNWEQKEQVQFREYEALTQEQYDVLVEGESTEDIYFGAQYEVEDSEKYEVDGNTYWDCRVRISRWRGTPDITMIPSEDFRIKERSTCIQESSFVAHVCEKTVGELIEMGFDEDDVQDVAFSAHDESGVPGARFRQPRENDIGNDAVEGSKYDMLVELAEAYVKLYDPEEERNKIYRCMQVGQKCLEYQEVDRIPIISLSPIMIPHKYSGLAVADLVRDIQEIRSTIMRQVLDNLALQNSGRYTAIEGQVNLQDLIDNRIGGIVRQKTPGAVQRLDTPDLSAATIPTMEMLDVQKENRTGVSRMTAGLDQSALSSHQTASAVNQVMTAAQSKILLIARNFAETGVKELFVELYNLIREHQTTPDMVSINGRYALVNPTEWIERNDVHVNVGIGNGNKDQQLFHLQQIGQMLGAMQQGPYGYLVTAENSFNLATEFIKNSGYINPQQFISNPANVEPPPPQPDPTLIVAQSTQMDAETKRMKAQADAQMNQGELQLDGAKFEWQKKVDAAETALEADQKRPVGIDNAG
jgi:hypothetical protein